MIVKQLTSTSCVPLSLGAEGGPVCNDKKNWVDIPNVGQKGAIQYGVQYGRRTLLPNITPSGSGLE